MKKIVLNSIKVFELYFYKDRFKIENNDTLSINEWQSFI